MTKSVLLLTSALVALIATIYFVIGSHQEKKELTDDVRSEAPGHFATLEHGKVHYLLQGADTLPLIVFIHGGGVTGIEVWKKNIPFFLDKGFRILSYDLYGRGYSVRASLKNSPELFMEQLTQLLSVLGISQSFHIVAMSMGAIVALDYAEANPGRVQKIILIDPAASGDYRPNLLLKVPVVSHFLMTVYWYPRAVENQRKEFADKSLFREYANRLEYFMDFEGYKFINHSTWMNMLSQNRIDLLKRLRPSQVLVIYGSQDPYFNESQDKLYRSGLPAMQIIKIDSAGHMPHYEKPDEVNKRISAFLINETGAR